jgi:DNA-binding NarL/FixJ family response regulator
MSTLTARQVEVLRMIGKGMTRVQIAKEISRSPKTVDAHQHRLMLRLGVDTRADLMRLAIREGLAQA